MLFPQLHIRLFFRKLTVFTLIVSVLSAVIFFFLPAKYISPAYPFLVLFFYLSSLLIYSVLVKSLVKRPAVFINNFLMMTVGKIFLLMIFLFFYLYFNRADAIPFVTSFFILYLLFTAFELIEVMKLLKMKKKNPSEK